MSASTWQTAPFPIFLVSVAHTWRMKNIFIFIHESFHLSWWLKMYRTDMQRLPGDWRRRGCIVVVCIYIYIYIYLLIHFFNVCVAIRVSLRIDIALPKNKVGTTITLVANRNKTTSNNKIILTYNPQWAYVIACLVLALVLTLCAQSTFSYTIQVAMASRRHGTQWVPLCLGGFGNSLIGITFFVAS